MISFKLGTFYGLTLNSDIKSVNQGPDFIDVFRQNGLEMKNFGPKNPMTYSIYSETSASQISVSIANTGFITVLMRERRFGKNETNLCQDLELVLATIEVLKSKYNTSINQENTENVNAVNRCISNKVK